MREIYEIDTDKIDQIDSDNNIYHERQKIVDAVESIKDYSSEVTIFVLAYNKIENTRRCIESVLKYTKGISYDLILMDNGSDDETYEYFKSIKHDKIRIVRVNKNRGIGITAFFLDMRWISKYYVTLANDIIVTENWLDNLLAVAKSDEKIGIVNPMSSNVSNIQGYDIDFTDFDDMQEKAKRFNKSDPTKWQERMRVITLGTLYTKECLLTIGWPCFDCGFSHNFGDDDVSFRARRAGYKIILACDTWVCHNHSYSTDDQKKFDEYNMSLSIGRENFKEKYYGVDAWDDSTNYVSEFIDNYITMPPSTENVTILGVDVRCGPPILDIKNSIRKYGIFNTKNYAFTTDSKYDVDLRTICNGAVVCDRTDFIYNSFKPDFFNYIIIGENINEYDKPEKVIRDLYSLLKPQGQLFLSLKNTYNIFTLLETMGYDINYSDPARHYNLDAFFEKVKSMCIDIELINNEMVSANETIINFINQIIPFASFEKFTRDTVVNKLLIEKFWFKITKR